MLIAIAHNAVSPDSREDERDVLVQVETVRQSLEELGYRSELLPVTLNLAAAEKGLRAIRPDVVFNLVESLAGSDRFAAIAVGLFEQLGLPVTGSDSNALWISNQKTLAKRELLMAGLPTAEWYEATRSSRVLRHFPPGQSFTHGSRFILKPVFEHASRGMDESAILAPRDEMNLASVLNERSKALGCTCFAECFIEGREFNVSLLDSPDGCEVLPLAETDFSAFPTGMPRIVDYNAKWNESSFAYHHTPRQFIDENAEPELSREIRRLAEACWLAFDLAGYVRVDFRVDDAGQPWILEMNTNPCLSPDAGYAATLKHAGIRLTQAIDRIINAARQRGHYA